jgi:hypothetical protein
MIDLTGLVGLVTTIELVFGIKLETEFAPKSDLFGAAKVKVGE